MTIRFRCIGSPDGAHTLFRTGDALLCDTDFRALARTGASSTAELQARLDQARDEGGGAIHLPRFQTTYVLPAGLVCGQNTPVSLHGPPGACHLRYDGDPASPAFRVDRAWGYRLSGFDIRKNPEDRTGTGLWVEPDTSVPDGTGTVSGDAVYEQLGFYGFQYGARFGNVARQVATSEITFLHCEAKNNDTGFYFDDFNTLNMVFVNPGLTGNRIGIHCTSGGFVTVLGGTGGYNDMADFVIDQAQQLRVIGYRSENTNSLFWGGATGAPDCLEFQNCSVNQRADATDPAMHIRGGSRIGIRDCHVGGRIVFEGNGQGGSIVLENCTIKADRPLDINVLPGAPPYAVKVFGCCQVDASGNFVKWFKNYEGWFGAWSGGDHNQPCDPWA